MEILKRALADTSARFSLSLGTAVQSVLVPTAFVVCMHLFRGKDAAMTEAADIILYIAAFIGVAVIPVFLWNLWLAPYKLMGERLDKAIEETGVGAPQRIPPGHATDAWLKVRLLTLEESACLWVGLEPHSPITDQRAKAALSQLKGAVKTGQLQCNWHNSLAALHVLLGHGDTSWPTEKQAISNVSLAVYAHETNQVVPKFLENVNVPPKEKELIS